MTNCKRQIVHTGLWLAVVVSPLGCAATRTEPAAVDYNTLDDAAFLHDHLVNQALVTVDEAYKVGLILADGEDTTGGFAERETKLAERSIIRPAWNLAPDQYVDMGTVAYMVCQICEVTGGVNRVLLGSWGLGDRRYALRELKFRKIIQGGSDYSLVSGGELLGILHRADTYMEQAGVQDAAPVPVPDAEDPSTFKQPAAPTQ